MLYGNGMAVATREEELPLGAQPKEELPLGAQPNP